MGKTIKLKDVNEDLAELQRVKAFVESREVENATFYKLRPVDENESVLEFRGDVVASAVYYLLQRVRRLEKRVLELEGDA